MRNVYNLAENLSTSILLAFGCFLFTIFLAIIYFSKEKQSDLRSKMYRVILSVVLTVLGTEFLYLLCLAYINSEVIITCIRIVHWLAFIFWVGFFCIYCVVYMQKLEYDNFTALIKNSKNSCALFVALCVLLLAYIILPRTSVDVNQVVVICGYSDFGILFGLTCMCSYTLICAYTLYKQYPLRRKIAITLIMLVLLAMLVLQILFNNISVYVICCSLQVFFLYFIIENPDIHLAREIESLKSDIDRSNRSKTDFLSNLSHEIRTPMNAIIGFSDSLLNTSKFDEKMARNDLLSIATAGTNLVDIINNILDISKIESGNDTLDCKSFNIAKTVKELGSIIEARIGNNPVKLYIDLDEQIPSKVYGDATKVYQILLNITNNAVKYTEVGKIKLSIVAERNDPEKVLLHIKISDTGYGIKKEDYSKIFEKFSRLDSAISKEIEGTGLGLVITKKFVDLMGGKIWFTSEFEVGTTFYVDLPLKVIDPTPIGSVQQESNSTRIRDFLDCSDFTALVVDDSKLNLKVSERLLKKYNFNVDTAISGKDCIYKFKYGNHYDIIFLDHMMPEMDGIETVKIIKRLDDYEIPPIVALTANAMNGMEEKYLSEGFDCYLSLPINTQELDRIIHRFFEDKTIMSVSEKARREREAAGKSVVGTEEKISQGNLKAEVRHDVKPVVTEDEFDEKSKGEVIVVDEKPEVKEEIKSEVEAPVEEKVEVKEEVKTESETPVEEKAEAETPVEEKVEAKEETKTEAETPVEEKTEVKEETKTEAETPVEEKAEVKEEVKNEAVAPVEEKAEVKEETKTEAVAPVEEKTEVKEETKTEAETPVEEKTEVKADDAVEVATDKSDSAMETYLRDKGVDMDKSLELLGDIEMYNMTIVDFITDVHSKWDRINQYKEAEDMPNYAIEVHSLKSDCKYLGFMRLADLSYQHELKSKENDVNFVKENFESLSLEYNNTIKLVEDYMKRYELS